MIRPFQLLGGVGAFTRNVAVLATGAAISQLIVLAALPLLTRLYDPVQYGGAAVFASFVGLIVVIASLRYEFAIPLPRRDGAAFHMVAISFFFVVAIALLSGAGFYLAGFFWPQDTGLSDYLFQVLIVVGTLSAGFYNIANYWAVRKKRFGVISRTRIQQGVTGTGVQLLMGITGFGVLGLVVGQIIGQCAGLSRLAIGLFADRKKNKTAIRRSRLSWGMRRYRHFPLYDSAAGLLNVASGQAPILLFSALFSPALAGYYALAYRVLSAPIGLVGKAISQALLPRIIEANRHGDAGHLMIKLLNALAMLSLFPFAVIAVISDNITPIVFGAEWAPAANVVAWTALWVGWQFICSPLSIILIGIEAQRLNAALQLGLLAIRLFALVVGAVLNSAEIALAAFSVASLLGYAGYTVATGMAVGLSIKNMARAIWQPTLLALACFAVKPVVPVSMPDIRIIAIGILALFWLWLCSRIVKVAKSHNGLMT